MFKRHKPAQVAAPHPVTPVAYRRPASPDLRIAAVEAMEREYFLADAIRTSMDEIGNRDGHTYQSGIAQGVARAIARLIGKDYICVQSTLSRGKSPLSWGTIAWVPADYTNRFDCIEDEMERIEARHRDALCADGHPLYTIKYHPERLHA